MSLDDSSDTFSAASGRFEIGDADFKLTFGGTASDSGIYGQIHGTGARSVSGIWSTEAENWHGGFAVARATYGSFSVTDATAHIASGEFHGIGGASQVTFRDPTSFDIADVATATVAGNNWIAGSLAATSRDFDATMTSSHHYGAITVRDGLNANHGISNVGKLNELSVDASRLIEFQYLRITSTNTYGYAVSGPALSNAPTSGAFDYLGAFHAKIEEITMPILLLDEPPRCPLGGCGAGSA